MYSRLARKGVEMSNEEDFTGKFLENFNRLTEFFRKSESGILGVEINLKVGVLLEDVSRKERPLRMLQNLAETHYRDESINNGFNIMLKQIADLRMQIEESHKKVAFNSIEFDRGYKLVKERLKQILEKS
jgi:hypothetical protein